MNIKVSRLKQSGALIVLIVAGLVSLLGLAIDSGCAYFERRNARQAADLAAQAGALAMAQRQDFALAAYTQAARDGYNNDGTSNMVLVNNPPGMSCDGTTGSFAGKSDYVQVIIQTDFHVYFAQIVGIHEAHTCVEALEEVTPPAYSFQD